MTETIADRIQQRLDLLGKTPSGAAVEAGLGRSSIRDILMGRSQHSRIDTLRKLSVVLETSVEYLTGQTADPASKERTDASDSFNFQITQARTILEAGVFRPAKDADNRGSPTENFVALPEPRLAGWEPSIYLLADDSMAAAGWSNRDIISAYHNPDGEVIELYHGTFVIARQEIESAGLVEWSARRVHVEDDDRVYLECVPAENKKTQDAFATVEIGEELRLNTYAVDRGRIITIEGLVGTVIREMPIHQS
ncbi:helix-turn-helix domain-containing protein [Pararhizobium sp. DWP1-1-3]|uniref:helix-turn-helix domain-containing protein n=1 Tax=Pararhizobium sp. DWP1-1-3 TaxID=2804652 RepID=UPI003CF70068